MATTVKKRKMAAKKKPATKAKTVTVRKKTSFFNSQGMVMFAIIFAVVGSYFLLRSFAASPNGKGGKTGGTAPLSLSVLQVWNNPNSPVWCDNEDDVHEYQGTGSLSGSLSSTQQYCGLKSDFYNNVYWDAGGEGSGLEAVSSGPLTDMAITSPSGDVHHAVLVGTSTAKGITTYHYQTCYVPAYSNAIDSGGGTPLPGGTWTFSITGNVKNVTYTTRTDMTDVRFQQTYCPVSQQNII